jgi:PHD-like zinc-binding domain
LEKVSQFFLLFSCHTNCAEYSPEIEVFEGKWKGVFSTVDRSRFSQCVKCSQFGATIRCSGPSCSDNYHFPCACQLGWKYDENGTDFFCAKHKELSDNSIRSTDDGESQSNPRVIDTPVIPATADDNITKSVVVIDSSDDELEKQPIPDVSPAIHDPTAFSVDIPLASSLKGYKFNGSRYTLRLGRLSRKSVHDRWNVEFYATCIDNTSARVLTIATTDPDPFDQFEEGDIIKSVNGIRIGSKDMDTLKKFFMFINQQVEVLVEVRRHRGSSFLWY